jgi:hypothetical protein
MGQSPNPPIDTQAVVALYALITAPQRDLDSANAESI